jgi:DNA-binding CsgD family transcriptional regulator/tetratricopeptide (TPR) repeat protein
MARVRSPILVGRTDPLARLEGAMLDALAGRSSVSVVEGEAGIGKSRLVEASLADIGQRHGVRGLVGGCLDIGGVAAPFAPYLELLRGLRRSLLDDGATGLFERHAPELAPLVGGHSDPATHGDADVRRARLYGAVLDLLRDAGSDRPTVVVIEDLHWADRSTLELTGFLARTLRDSPVALIVTMRSDERRHDPGRQDLLAALLADHATTRIQLDRLGVDEIRSLVGAIAGRPVAEPTVVSIHARSEGNPYLAEELIAIAAAGDPVGLPPAPRDIVLARLATLTPEAQQVVHATAIAGSWADLDRLAAVVGLQDATFRRAVRNALDDAILVRLPVGERADRVALRHALSREAVEADLLASERRNLHARWAEVLTSSEAHSAAQIAHHWEQAGRPDLALPYLLREAADATASLAFDASARAYERALAILQSGDAIQKHPSVDLVAILGSAAEAMRFSGRHLDAVVLGERQLALIPDADVLARAGALERIGTYQMDVGDNEGAIESTTRAVALLRGGPPAASARALISNVICRAHLLRLDGTLETIEEAIELARAERLAALESIALCQRGLILTWLGDVDGGEADLERALSLALESGDVEAILLAAMDRPVTEDARGDFVLGYKRCLRSIEVARTTGAMQSFEALGLIVGTSSVAAILGRWDDADRLLDEADELDVLERVRHGKSSVRARIACGRGDLEEAKRQIGRPQVDFGPQTDVDRAIVEALVARLDGRPAAAVNAVVAGLEHAAPIDTFLGRRQRAEIAAIGISAATDVPSKTVRPTGAAERAVGAVDESVAALVAALELATHDRADRADPVLEAWSAQARGELARLQSRPVPALWTDAVRRWADLGCRELEGWARLREGEAIVLARGDRAVAASTLRDALEIAVDIGATPLRIEVEGLLRRARIPETEVRRLGKRPQPSEPYGLTARERDVLGLIAAGMTNRQIADALFIAPKTAGVHVSSILGKLGVRGRVEAATLALREGLVQK